MIDRNINSGILLSYPIVSFRIFMLAATQDMLLD